eukprot:CAMPEP_0184300554 /NCGR_PEP_ID=MMETSP1049-20130417/10953_1 /TAXON_ID=77928 /ORGANISM="Proteomonas sulcata, Strain CCMP704" /LENGTH=33 /DNA_ID= /DNA_START= /DNA_END= /DNA_ORIENTATION=
MEGLTDGGRAAVSNLVDMGFPQQRALKAAQITG